MKNENLFVLKPETDYDVEFLKNAHSFKNVKEITPDKLMILGSCLHDRKEWCRSKRKSGEIDIINRLEKDFGIES